MKIPVGNFGLQVAQPGPAPRLSPGEFDNGAQVMQAVGAAITRTAEHALHEQRRLQEEEDRSTATVALIGHKSALEDAMNGVKERIAAGDVSRDKAAEAFSSEAAKVRSKTLDDIPEWLRKSSATRIEGEWLQAVQGFGRYLDGLRRDELAGNLETIRDTMAKDAGRPGADIDKLNSEFEQAANHLGPQAGVGADKLVKLVQDFKDRNWFNQAQARALSARDSQSDLQALEKDITDSDGFYANRLDTEKRNAILRTVSADRDRLANRIRIDADKRQADGEKVVQEFRNQIATTTKARPDDYLNWSARVKGTPSEAEFVELLSVERDVQKVVGMPPQDQDKYLSDARAAQRLHGASEKQIRMLNALEEAVGKNRKLMSDDPLRYLTERTGQSFQPLTPAMLQQGQEAVGKEIQARLSALAGLRQMTGGRTELKVFTRDEADQVSKALADVPPAAQGEMLGLLRGAISYPRAYADTVRQVAKDDPVLAYAGIAKGRNLMTSNGRALSDLLLEGRSIIRDGSFKMPAEKAGSVSMQQAFSEYIGNAIEPGASSAREDTFKAASAVYAKLAKDAGRTDGALDAGLYEQATRLVTGGIVEHAGYKTIPPYGMASDVFNDRARSAKFAAEKASEAPAGSFAAMQLRAVGPNRYELLNGQRRQVGKDGAPIILTIE